MTFQRINFTGCQNALFLLLGSRSGATVGSIQGITFRDITGSNMTDTRGCPITGCFTNGQTYKLQNLRFDNVNIAYKGALNFIPTNPPVEYSGQYPENTLWTNLPAYGYYVRHATNVVFTNCFTSVAPAEARPWLATEDVASLSVLGPVLNLLPDPANLTLQWRYNFVLQSATNLGGIYLDVIGAPNPCTNPFAAGPQRFFRLRQ